MDDALPVEDPIVPKQQTDKKVSDMIRRMSERSPGQTEELVLSDNSYSKYKAEVDKVLSYQKKLWVSNVSTGISKAVRLQDVDRIADQSQFATAVNQNFRTLASKVDSISLELAFKVREIRQLEKGLNKQAELLVKANLAYNKATQENVQKQLKLVQNRFEDMEASFEWLKRKTAEEIGQGEVYKKEPIFSDKKHHAAKKQTEKKSEGGLFSLMGMAKDAEEVAAGSMVLKMLGWATPAIAAAAIGAVVYESGFLGQFWGKYGSNIEKSLGSLIKNSAEGIWNWVVDDFEGKHKELNASIARGNAEIQAAGNKILGEIRSFASQEFKDRPKWSGGTGAIDRKLDAAQDRLNDIITKHGGKAYHGEYQNPITGLAKTGKLLLNKLPKDDGKNYNDHRGDRYKDPSLTQRPAWMAPERAFNIRSAHGFDSSDSHLQALSLLPGISNHTQSVHGRVNYFGGGIAVPSGRHGHASSFYHSKTTPLNSMPDDVGLGEEDVAQAHFKNWIEGPTPWGNIAPDVNAITRGMAGTASRGGGEGSYNVPGQRSMGPVSESEAGTKQVQAPYKESMLTKYMGGQQGSSASGKFLPPRNNPNVNPAMLDYFNKHPANAPEGLPAAFRTNNPGAISITGNVAKSWAAQQAGFAGTTPRPADEGGYYAKFATPEHGIHAEAALLKSYEKRGRDTVATILHTWAAKGQGQYIASVAKEMGVGPNDKLDFNNPDVLQKFMMAQAKYESGSKGILPYKDDVYARGVRGQFEAKYEGPSTDKIVKTASRNQALLQKSQTARLSANSGDKNLSMFSGDTRGQLGPAAPYDPKSGYPMPSVGKARWNYAQHLGDPRSKAIASQMTTVHTEFGNLTLNRNAAVAWQGWAHDMKQAGAPFDSFGTLSVRKQNTKYGVGKNWSEHSYGVAGDVDDAEPGHLPRKVVDWMVANHDKIVGIDHKWGFKWNPYTEDSPNSGDNPHFEWGGAVSQEAYDQLTAKQKTDMKAPMKLGGPPPGRKHGHDHAFYKNKSMNKGQGPTIANASKSVHIRHDSSFYKAPVSHVQTGQNGAIVGGMSPAHLQRLHVAAITADRPKPPVETMRPLPPPNKTEMAHFLQGSKETNKTMKAMHGLDPQHTAKGQQKKIDNSVAQSKQIPAGNPARNDRSDTSQGGPGDNGTGAADSVCFV